MRRATSLFRSPILQIDALDHPSRIPHVDGQLEALHEYAVTFVETGEFRVARGATAWDFTPGDILLSYPGVTQRVTHPQAVAADTCLKVSFTCEAVHDTLGKAPRANVPARICRSARNQFQLSRLRASLACSDGIMTEETLLLTAQDLLGGSATPPSMTAVDRSFAWYNRRIARVCEYLDDEYANSHGLTELASMAGISVFHFSRVFHYLVGMPVHQYVVRRRLLGAVLSMREGRSVVEAAFASGFSSLSYFSRRFRQQFGKSPRGFLESTRSLSTH